MAHVMRPLRGLEARPTPATRATMARTPPPAPGSMARRGRAVEVTPRLLETRGTKVQRMRVLP